MLPPQHHGGGVVLVLGGSSSPKGGGDSPMPGREPSAIPLPKGFDAGGAQPGDTITVQMDCRISEDGKHLIPLSVDGSSTDDDDDTAAPDQAPAGDDGSTPGSRWQNMMGGK